MSLTSVPITTLQSVIVAHHAWDGMTRTQRMALQGIPALTAVNTQASLWRRGLIDDESILTSWGRYVLHVQSPKMYPIPEAVLIPTDVFAKFWTERTS